MKFSRRKWKKLQQDIDDARKHLTDFERGCLEEPLTGADAPGHFQCGFCYVHHKPRFNCGCFTPRKPAHDTNNERCADCGFPLGDAYYQAVPGIGDLCIDCHTARFPPRGRQDG